MYGEPNLSPMYFLISKYISDISKGVVEIFDLTSFKVLHIWNPDLNKFNSLVEKKKGFKKLSINSNDKRARLVHQILTKDGELLFYISGLPLIKIDKCSNLIFQNTHDQFHHSIETDIDDNIYAQLISTLKLFI